MPVGAWITGAQTGSLTRMVKLADTDLPPCIMNDKCFAHFGPYVFFHPVD